MLSKNTLTSTGVHAMTGINTLKCAKNKFPTPLQPPPPWTTDMRQLGTKNATKSDPAICMFQQESDSSDQEPIFSLQLSRVGVPVATADSALCSLLTQEEC